ncbi:hypothetical protein CSX12_12235 [Microbacterium sp. Y-01]|nr:hypothetical protein CSX12_12235 [Microbacterium sp. Y-01]
MGVSSLWVSVCITIDTSGRGRGLGADWGLGGFGFVMFTPDWANCIEGYYNKSRHETGEHEAETPVRQLRSFLVLRVAVGDLTCLDLKHIVFQLVSGHVGIHPRIDNIASGR